MLCSERVDRAVLDMQLPLGVVNERLSGQSKVAHGVVFGGVASAGVAEGRDGVATALREAGLAGKYNEPVWPQAATVSTLRARASGLTRIWAAFNIVKL